MKSDSIEMINLEFKAILKYMLIELLLDLFMFN